MPHWLRPINDRHLCMDDYLRAVEKSLETENWHAAVALTLTLPDVCARLEEPTVRNKWSYMRWYERYVLSTFQMSILGTTSTFLTAKDCYALRCAFLHAGSDDISNEEIRDALIKFHFCVTGSHLAKLNNVLILDVKEFCTAFLDGVRHWQVAYKNDANIQTRIKNLARIETDTFSPLPGVFVK